MQYLKDEIRNNIMKEALKEFKQKGYKGSSIRTIAKNSTTSVGNFYKYFDSKDHLYENLMESVYVRLMDCIKQFDRVELNDKAEDTFYQLMERLMEIFAQNSTELAVLLNKSEGSKYENCKKNFIAFVFKIVTDYMKYKLSLEGKKLKDNFIIYLLSNSLVESIAIILQEKDDGAEVKKLILNLIDIFYMDTVNKLDSEIIQ
jgi:AcrR family transcriptional regulator